jgi:hypothetical protein
LRPEVSNALRPLSPALRPDSRPSNFGFRASDFLPTFVLISRRAPFPCKEHGADCERTAAAIDAIDKLTDRKHICQSSIKILN